MEACKWEFEIGSLWSYEFIHVLLADSDGIILVTVNNWLHNDYLSQNKMPRSLTSFLVADYYKFDQFYMCTKPLVKWCSSVWVTNPSTVMVDGG